MDGGRTAVEYYAWSDPGGIIPARPASRFAAGAIERLLNDMEAFAKEVAHLPRAGFLRPDQTPL